MADSPVPEIPLEDLVRAAYESDKKSADEVHDTLVSAMLAAAGNQPLSFDRSGVQEMVSRFQANLDILADILDRGGEGDRSDVRNALLMMMRSDELARLTAPGLLSSLSEHDRTDCINCITRLGNMLERSRE